MDGNGRWAKNKGLPRSDGHVKGAEAVRHIVEASVRAGISYLTLFAFSSENWQRPAAEVSQIMGLFLTRLASELETMKEHNVRLKIIGDRTSFSAGLCQQVAATERETEDNRGLCLSLAINYGGRWDICRAAQQVAREVKAGLIGEDEITSEIFASHLSTAGLPDPDLLIRTGGESRISNFLLWQLSYAELYFTDVLWPEFGAGELQDALNWYSGRQRRFGKVSSSSETLAGV